MSSYDQGYTCIECEHSYDDRDGDLDERMCFECLDKIKVPFNFRYHAEIQYETELGFNFCNANGNTLDELLCDIDERLDQYKDRLPELSLVLKDPNGEQIDITNDVLKRLKEKSQ